VWRKHCPVLCASDFMSPAGARHPAFLRNE
jgi:hypothetical protein